MAVPPTVRRKRVALLAAGAAVVVAVSGLVAANSGSTASPANSTSNSSSTTSSTLTTDSTDALASTGPSGVVTTGTPPAGGGVVLPAGFRVKAGRAAAAAGDTAKVVNGAPIGQDIVARILGRLPAWTGTSDLGTDFKWPTQTLSKPTAGKTINQSFPASGNSQSPPTTPTTTPAGPVQVLRMQPEGAVSVAPFISITFNQPMVPVGTIEQQEKSPATISPTVKGHWDWIGTDTLRFTADAETVDRLPMATKFTVTVPAGTRSQSGSALAKAATATFTTPAPKVLSFTPGSKEPVKLRPVMVAVFNQQVDPQTVLKSVEVRAGSEVTPVRPATEAEIAADQSAAAAVSGAPAGRAVAFVPTGNFSTGTKINVTVKAGTRSAEGPLTSAADAAYSFTTYSPLKFVTIKCQYGPCQPGSPLAMSFTNSLDAGEFDPSSVTVTPALPAGSVVTTQGSDIVIAGVTQPSTTYQVSVKAGLKDVFGQTLSQDVKGSIPMLAAQTQIYSFPTSVSTIDPNGAKPTITLTTVNQRRVRERVFSVDVKDFQSYSAWYTNLLQENGAQLSKTVTAPWPVLVDRTVNITGSENGLIATSLDLSPQLTGDRHQVVVLIENIDPVTSDELYNNRPTTTWVQSTDLAVDAFVDQTDLHAWVTDLRSNTPISGATVQMLDQSGRPVNDKMLTNGQGLSQSALSSSSVGALLATKGADQALLPASMWGGVWQANPGNQDWLLWYINNDRQTYRPGETVSMKGWVRQQRNDSTLAMTIPSTGQVKWTANDGNGQQIGTGTAAPDKSGGFDFTFPIPAGAHLGNAYLTLDLSNGEQYQSLGGEYYFTIADFRTPAFEVQTHAATGDSAVRGSDVNVQADAGYYAGGPVGGAAVTWQVKTAEASYSPPGWSNFTFRHLDAVVVRDRLAGRLSRLLLRKRRRPG